MNAEVGRTALGTLLAGAPLGIAGTGLGALLRSQIAAVLAVAAWVAIGDGVSLSSSDPTLRAGCPAGWPAPSPHPESTPSRCGLRLWCRRRGPRRAGGARNRRVDQLGADVGACASEPVACAGASTGLSGPGPSVVRAPVREHGGVAPSRARTHDFFNSLERVALVGGGGARLRIAAGGGTRWEQNFWVTASVTVGSGRRWSVTRIAGRSRLPGATTRPRHGPRPPRASTTRVETSVAPPARANPAASGSDVTIRPTCSCRGTQHATMTPRRASSHRAHPRWTWCGNTSSGTSRRAPRARHSGGRRRRSLR